MVVVLLVLLLLLLVGPGLLPVRQYRPEEWDLLFGQTRGEMCIGGVEAAVAAVELRSTVVVVVVGEVPVQMVGRECHCKEFQTEGEAEEAVEVVEVVRP